MTPAERRLLRRYQRMAGKMAEALQAYADPGFYHAVAFLFDRPCGEFSEDFDKQHDEFNRFGGPGYDYAKPGKLARKTLRHVVKHYGDLTIIGRTVAHGQGDEEDPAEAGQG